MFSRKTRVTVDVHLAVRVQPMHRGAFEDPLAAALKSTFGRSTRIVGSGTEFTPEEGPLSADLEIEHVVRGEDDVAEVMELAASVLTESGAPRGSYVAAEGHARIPCGELVGVAIHLDATTVHERHADRDVNELIDRLHDVLGDEAWMPSYWESDTRTSLYLYGDSDARMRELVASVLDGEPLAEGSTIESLHPGE